MIIGEELKATALKHAQRDLQLYAQKYRKSKKADFYGDRKAMVNDFRTFLYEEVGRMRDTWYYQHTDLTMEDYGDIIEAMCADFNLKMRLKPEDVVIGTLRTTAKGYRGQFRNDFDSDPELYRLFLAHKLYEALPTLIQKVYGYGKVNELSKAQQAELVLLIVSEEIETLKQHRKAVLV